MNITIPKLSLVVLVGPSGSGKSTFARKHFLPTEVLSSDYCRGLVSEVHLITDSSKTEFHGVSTRTCLAIGPDDAEKTDNITGELQLL